MGNGSDPTLPNDEPVSTSSTRAASTRRSTTNNMFKWPFLTDPKGVFRNYYAFPGTCVPHDYPGFSSKVTDMGWTKNETPARYRVRARSTRTASRNRPHASGSCCK